MRTLSQESQKKLGNILDENISALSQFYLSIPSLYPDEFRSINFPIFVLNDGNGSDCACRCLLKILWELGLGYRCPEN